MAEHSFDTLIVGGGLVGCAAALGLHRLGYSVGLLERSAPKEMLGRLGFDPRMLALAPKWKPFLESFATSAWSHKGSFDRLCAWEELGTAEVSFSAAEADVECLGFMASMSDLQTRLWSLIEDSDINVFLGEEIEDINVDVDRVNVTGSIDLSAELLIGADGASSKVRDLLHLDTSVRPTGQSAIVTVVEVSEHHKDTAYQRFLHDGPLALLPLASSDSHHYVSIVWSQSSAQADRRAALDEDAFCAELSEASERRLGEVLRCDDRYKLPLEQQVATSHAPGSRTLLLGDSARVIHPLAGQGANLGLEDVEALLDTLTDRPRDPGASDLWKTFSRTRLIRSKTMVAAMEIFRRVYAVDDPTFSWLRNVGVRFVDRADLVKQLFLREALGDSLLIRLAEKMKWTS